MKLSQYAKKAGVSYRTAFRWWKAGQLKGYQTASKTIIVTEEDQSPVVGPTMVAIHARVNRHHRGTNHRGLILFSDDDRLRGRLVAFQLPSLPPPKRCPVAHACFLSVLTQLHAESISYISLYVNICHSCSETFSTPISPTLMTKQPALRPFLKTE